MEFQQLVVHWGNQILDVQECRVLAKYGEHTKAKVKAIGREEEEKETLIHRSEEKVHIQMRKMQTQGDVLVESLFSGILEQVEMREEGRHRIFLLEAVSETWKMDVEKKSRSFQDISMTYRELAENIVMEYGGTLFWNLRNRQMEYPLIQYKETDYEFLQRLLSHLQGGIWAGDFTKRLCIHGGIGMGEDRGEIELSQYSHSVLTFHTNQGDSLEKRPRGYYLKDIDYMRIGDWVQIQGRTFYVMKSCTFFSHNQIYCHCTVFPKQCFEIDKIDAKTIKAAVLTGTIIDTRQEMVKMHLDIDQEQNPSEAYEFPWKPMTGNMMYDMPEIGTRAGLYFCEPLEKTGAVIYNIRENGEQCQEMEDNNCKYFTTDCGKRLYLKPSQIGFLHLGKESMEIGLEDKRAVNMRADSQFIVRAKGQVELKGKNVVLSASKEATLVKKDLLSPTVINLCNTFDAVGKNAGFTSTEKVVEKRRKISFPSQEEESFSLEGVTQHILSNIPVPIFQSSVLEGVAGSMPIITMVRERGKAGMKK